MAKVSIILDKRTTDDQGRNPIKVRITSNNTNTTVCTDQYVDARNYIGTCECAVARTYAGAKYINNIVHDLYYQYVSAIIDLERSGRIRVMSASDIREYVEKKKEFVSERTFTECLQEYRDACRAFKTRQAYDYTLQMMERCKGKRKFLFEEINYKFLTDLDNWMLDDNKSISSRSIVFRNMRTVYNYAINNDWVGIQSYPFRKFKIKSSRKEKDTLSLDMMRKLLNIQLKGEEKIARDFFLLSFYLCGINPIDLYNLKRPTDSGEIIYVRQKVAHNEPLPVHAFLTPQSIDLSNNYSSQSYIVNFCECHKNYDTFKRRMSDKLSSVGRQIGCKQLYYYMARYTWATFADHIGIPHDVISKSLGHSDKSTAEKYYIDYDWDRTRQANERVIDYLLHGNSQYLLIDM